MKHLSVNNNLHQFPLGNQSPCEIGRGKRGILNHIKIGLQRIGFLSVGLQFIIDTNKLKACDSNEESAYYKIEKRNYVNG